MQRKKQTSTAARALPADLHAGKPAANNLLKKHVATIHCSNTLSLLQRKISNALLYYAYPTLMTQEEHEITVRQLCQIIGYQGNNHAAIKTALRGLISTVIEWNMIADDTKEEDWTASTILASVRIKGPLCYYAYSPRMKALLHSPSVYGKINLIIQAKFKSNYGLALYENCVRYQGLPSTKWFNLDLFRKLMGVPDNQYTIFRDFKRRVLDKSVQEVNDYSEMQVQPEITRKGRQVTHIRFLLRANPAVAVNEHANAPQATNDLQNQLITQWKITPTRARQLCNEYDSAYIQEKLELIQNSNAYKLGQIKNLAAFIVAALKDDYQPAVSSQKQQADELRQREQLREMEAASRAKQERLEREYQAYVAEQIERALENMKQSQPEIYEKILGEFADYIRGLNASHFIARKYQENGLEHPGVKSLLRTYVQEYYQRCLSKMVSFEEYAAQQDAEKEGREENKGTDEPHNLSLEFN